MKRCESVLIVVTALLLFLSGCGSKVDSQRQNQETILVQSSDEDEEAKITESAENKYQEKEENEEGFISKEGTLETINFDSQAIGDNVIEEKTEQKLYIYLPPSYYESEKTYPVVYFLHGFGDSPTVFIRSAKKAFDPLFSKDSAKEFIIVAVDGSNSAGGSFYVNSPVTGKWEDYTSKEVVAYIDENYRTIANAEARGICGFSMGGFGALNLAFLHPDIYGAVYAMSPGVLAPGKIGDALDTWQNDAVFLKAYSLAFAYNTEPPYESIPLRDNSDSDNALLERWESGFGNWQEKLDDYLALSTPLRGIGLSYGTSDGYSWIPEGTEYVSGLLDEKNIDHILFNFKGGHILPPDVMKDHLLPFFQEYLKW